MPPLPMPTMTPPARDDDPYAALVLAIVRRAVQDACGEVSPSVAVPVAQLQDEARQWLADERAVTELLESAGYDAEPVQQRTRALLARQESVPVPVTRQLRLFEVD